MNISIYVHCMHVNMYRVLAKGSCEKSTILKDCWSDGCLERLSSKTAELMVVCKGCLQERLSSKTAAVTAVIKKCYQRPQKWWLSWKKVIKDCPSNGCLQRLQRRLLKESSDQRLPKWWLSSTTPEKTAEVMAVLKGCDQRLPKWLLSSKTDPSVCSSHIQRIAHVQQWRLVMTATFQKHWLYLSSQPRIPSFWMW